MKKLFVVALIATGIAATSCGTSTQAPTTEKDSAAYSAGVLTSAIIKQRADSTMSTDVVIEAFNDVYSNPTKAAAKLKELQAYLQAAEMAQSLYSQFDSTFNTAVIAAGINDGWASKTSMKPEEAQGKLMAYLASRATQEADAFLAEIDKKEGIQKSTSDLRYTVTAAGEGKINSNDTVMVKYTLFGMDGKQIESNVEAEPMKVSLPGGVVAGFAEGIQLVGKGGKATIYVPGKLGYGESPAQHQMGGKVLHFDIEVIDVIAYDSVANAAKVAAEALAAAKK